MNLLLAAVLLAQDPSAEEIFNKIEEALVKAKAVNLHFTMELTESGRDKKVTVTGEMAIKEGNKVTLVGLADMGDRKKETRLIADGARTITLRNGKATNPSTPIWPNLAEYMAVGFLRGGIGAIDRYIPRKEPEKDQETDIRKRLVVSHFETGRNDGEWKTICFRCTVTGQKESQEVVLSYEPKTFRLVKRAARSLREDVDLGMARETYEGFTLSGELSDDRFKLPEAKK